MSVRVSAGSCFNDAWQPGLPGSVDARARNRCYLTGNQALINQRRQLANGCPPGFPKKCSFIAKVSPARCEDAVRSSSVTCSRDGLPVLPVLQLGVGTIQEEFCVLDTVSCDNFKAVTTAVNKVCQV